MVRVEGLGWGFRVEEMGRRLEAKLQGKFSCLDVLWKPTIPSVEHMPLTTVVTDTDCAILACNAPAWSVVRLLPSWWARGQWHCIDPPPTPPPKCAVGPMCCALCCQLNCPPLSVAIISSLLLRMSQFRHCIFNTPKKNSNSAKFILWFQSFRGDKIVITRWSSSKSLSKGWHLFWWKFQQAIEV